MRQPKPWWRRYVAGLIAGAAGTAAMGLYQKALHKSNGRPQGHTEHDMSVIGRKHGEGESATAALGRIIYEKVRHKQPGPGIKGKLSNAVHWAYGTEMGGTYGLLHPRSLKLNLLGGLAYGAGLWVLGDELAVPLLGLAEGPKAYAGRLHAETLGAHLVYGVTTAAASELVERVL